MSRYVLQKSHTKLFSLLLGKGTVIAVKKTEEEKSEASKGEHTFDFPCISVVNNASFIYCLKLKLHLT